MATVTEYIRWLEDISIGDIGLVGGKNASSGEMIRTLKAQGIRVPDGFATTSAAYWRFLEHNDLERRIRSHLDALHDGSRSLEQVGRAIRRLFLASSFPGDVEGTIKGAYRELSSRYGLDDVDVAVRSSATAEDLPEASFAGQQETFLNVSGEEELMDACRRCYASLFTDRAIAYRQEESFDDLKVALSCGVQKMVRSDKAGSGVIFTLDTDTGFPDVVMVTAAWGLGENVVQGSVNPDEYMVFKPLLEDETLSPIVEKEAGAKEKKLVYSTGGSRTTRNVDTSHREQAAFVLSDPEILRLARWALVIERHYGKPMDIEWAKDGESGELYIVQSRPETVQSRKKAASISAFKLLERGEELITGLAIGEAIAAGRAQVIKNVSDIGTFEDGAILVTGMTDPDWVPIMKRAAGIVTDHGGRTSHAAIVSREFGIPALVGTGNATQALPDGEEITLSCAEGEVGRVYRGRLRFEESELNFDEVVKPSTPIMINLASPAAAFRWWRLPVQGVGLARMEFIINNIIKIHPMALVHLADLEDSGARREIERITYGYDDKSEYFVEKLALGIAKIGASQYPDLVIVRMSDFKSNEYANLIGGRQFEPEEENPMLGFRGASRYYSPRYREGFRLECRAIKRVREEMGLTNVIVMIPFCRTVDEADLVMDALADNGLRRGENGLQVYVMCEIPSNVVLAEQFAERFDGFSIGSNDLTQLVLGVDRDSAELKDLFDERNEAVKVMISDLIVRAHLKGRKVGICGQAPSDYPDFAAFLVREGIDTISLNPDSVLEVMNRLVEFEGEMAAVGTHGGGT